MQRCNNKQKQNDTFHIINIDKEEVNGKSIQKQKKEYTLLNNLIYIF